MVFAKAPPRPQSRRSTCLSRFTYVLTFICGFVFGKLDTPDCLPLEYFPEPTAPPTPPPIFSAGVSSFMVGAARVWKDELLEKFDLGLPLGKDFTNTTLRGEEEAWLFYSHGDVQPQDFQGRNFDHLSVEEATSKCKSVEIIVRHDPLPLHTCFAVVGNQDSKFNPILYRWVQLNTPEPELVQVGRGADLSWSFDPFPQPNDDNIRTFRKRLANYLSIVDDTLIPYISPILDQAAAHDDTGKTVVVTATNAGHLPLLQNFVCSSKARNMDISNFVVFCLDAETQERAKAMGLTTIYHEQLFGDVPSNGAASFGDETFKAVVYCKLVLTHLLSTMGFNFLYQDCDIAWYQNPMTFMQRVGYLDKFDLVFQDDGDRSSPHFKPYFGNSGFFFCKSNAVTKYFFRQLIYNADSLSVQTSEQVIFGATIPETISYLGMKVKTLSQRDFPAGHMFQYWANFDGFMEKLMMEQVKPVIFHMHFTKNLEAKIIQMKQMGIWYLTQNDETKKYMCSTEPAVECSYWDRPSVPSCRDKQNSMRKANPGAADPKRFWA